MSNLLSIETNFLNNATVKAAIQLTDIRSIQRTLSNGQKKKFEQTLALAKLVTAALSWFSSEEGKRVTSEEGIIWTNEEIGLKVFGWQKSYFYKVAKAGKLDATLVENFNTKCNELEHDGEEPNRTLEGLLKFAKRVHNETVTEPNSSSSLSEDEDISSEVQPEVREKPILVLTYKAEGHNVSLRIKADGSLVTNNTAEQIREAIAVLNFTLANNNLN